MKIKKMNADVLKILTCYFSLYIINLPQVLRYSDPELLFKTNILTILDIFFISCLATFIPCIHYINRGEKLDKKFGHKICLLNSIIICFVGLLFSYFLLRTYGYYFIISDIAGSVIYYFINRVLFTDFKKLDYYVVNLIEYTIVMSSILIILYISINYFRSSVDPPNYRIEENIYSENVNRS
ncbi:MAG: hypothetical protein IJS56_01995 [Bacilli bacterium]|nr:hypothetical protein [Bacilli bacterium]